MTPVRVQLINDNILDILLLNVARSDITLFSFCRYLMFANPASLYAAESKKIVWL